MGGVETEQKKLIKITLCFTLIDVFLIPFA